MAQMTVQKGPPRYSKLGALGLLMVALAPLLMLGASLAFGLEFGDDAGFLLAVTFVPLAGALLVRFLGLWGKIIGIAGALAAVSGIWWTAFGVEQPGSFFDFVPGVLAVPGALIAVVASLAAIVAGRRGHREPKATGGEKIAIRTLLVLLAAVMLVSGVLTYTGMSKISVADTSEVLTMKEFQFDPRAIEVEAGSSLLVKNNDPFFHTFTIDELGIDESLTLGDEVAVDFPDRPGTYIFYCRPHTGDRKSPSQDDMAGTITIS